MAPVSEAPRASASMSQTLHVLSRREANIFACVAETVVAPAGPLPPLARTDAVSFFDDCLGRAPAINRLGLRALLHVLELLPLARGYGARLRRLEPARRLRFVSELERGRMRDVVQPLRALAQLSYYGDPQVMLALGYDAGAVVDRGRALRAEEARW